MNVPHTEIVGASDAQAHFGELLAKVAAGEEITITQGDEPVARLVPIAKSSSPEARRAAIAHIKALSKGLSLGGLKIADLISEGRR